MYKIQAIFSAGKHEGKTIAQVVALGDRRYIGWYANSKFGTPEMRTECANYLEETPSPTILKNGGVTNMIKDRMPSVAIPELYQTSVLPVLARPTIFDPAKFGDFIEYFIRYRLSKKALVDFVDERAEFANSQIAEAYTRVCNMRASANDIFVLSLKSADKLAQYALVYEHLAKYGRTYIDYIDSICDRLLKISTDFKFNVNVSVMQIVGVADLVIGDCIVDFKCCTTDDIAYYRMQLYAYAAMINANSYTVKQCKIYSLVTGMIYTMTIPDDQEAGINFLKSLASRRAYRATV